MSQKFESPLKRAQAGKIGGKKVEEQHAEPETLKHNDVRTSTDQKLMKRQTVYIPEDLAMWLKIHAATTKDDISGIITRLAEEYRAKIEGK